MPYDHRSDMWSLGCVLYEIITFEPPFKATNMKGLYSKVIAGKFDPIPNHFSQDLKDVLKSMLQVRPTDRADCNKILNMHGFLNHITGTLDEIDAQKSTDTEKLLNTIRCPRNLGLINSSMPASKYPSIDSSNILL